MAGKSGSSRAPRVRGDARTLDGAGRYGGRGLNDFGKINAASNTKLGLALGLAGHAVGMASGRKPRIQLGHNAVEFINNPFGGPSAVTLGNASIYSTDPYKAGDRYHKPIHLTQRHEVQHTIQAEQLGGLYLPSNIAGGVMSLLFDRENGEPYWHGPHNWNEAGPQEPTPRPWPRSRSH